MHYQQSNKMLLAALDEYVTGHLEAKKALIIMLNRSKLRTHQKYRKYMADEYLVRPMKVLLIARSGTGKTHLLNSLQQIELFPLVKLDATHLNPTGASGGIKPEKLQTMIREEAERMCKLYPETYEYLEYAIEQTVVFVDEVDKLGSSFEGSGNWNKHIQSSFLTMFDNKDAFAGVSYVFAGAFDSITRHKAVKKQLGFNSVDEDLDTTHIEDKVLQSGLIPELVGRMNRIIELDVFTKQNFRDILVERIIPAKQRDLAAIGVFNVPLTDKEIDMIAEKATKSAQGVRFLQREIDNIYMDSEFDGEYDVAIDEDLYLPGDL